MNGESLDGPEDWADLSPEEKEAIEMLVDDEHKHWISNITNREFTLIRNLLIRSEVMGDEISKKIADLFLEIAPSREGNRVEKLVEFARACNDRQEVPAEATDAFRASGNLLESKDLAEEE